MEILTDQLQSYGGPILILLGLISIWATATALFKVLQFFQMGVGRHKEAVGIIELWQNGRRDDAVRQSANSSRAVTRVLAATLAALTARPADVARARELGTQAALKSLADMSRYMRVLESVVQAAPMLGLLGTVIGMIDAFGRLSESGGAVDPAVLAGGIWIALTTTAAGLAIAIPFYFVSMWLEGRIENERIAMEGIISQAVNANTPPPVNTTSTVVGTPYTNVMGEPAV